MAKWEVKRGCVVTSAGNVLEPGTVIDDKTLEIMRDMEGNETGKAPILSEDEIKRYVRVRKLVAYAEKVADEAPKNKLADLAPKKK